MTWRTAAPLDELEENLPLAVELDSDGGEEIPIALVEHGGGYYAVHNVCSHGQVPLSEGDVEDCTIECYLHGSTFDLRTGAALNLPATQPVPVYPCRVVGNDLEVDVDNPIPADALAS